MKIATDNEQILKTPRNTQIIVAKYFGAIFLSTGLMIIMGVIYGNVILEPPTAVTAFDSLGCILPTLIGSIIYFLPERYRTYLIYNKTNNLLKISTRGKTQEVSLAGVTSLISKKVSYSVGTATHFLILNKDECQTELFREQCFWATHWVAFTEKLALITGLPMTKERWAEDYNGKLHSITPQARKAARKRSWFVFMPAVLPLIGAFAYKMDPTRLTFILFGLATIILGNSSLIIYYLLNKSIIDRAENKSYIIINVIPFNIKMSLFYVGYSFALNGAKLPGIIQ